MPSIVEHLYDLFLSSSGVSIDTRTMQRNNLFFAISGPNFNANDFATNALEKGACYAVVDDKKYAKNNRFILVENALVALQQIATYHRSKYIKPVIAITGSNGKTTTKELVAKVLETKYKIHFTQGNFNNHIGVPLTLLQLDLACDMAIIEMGANHVGDIAFLCSIAEPTHGLITNIGHAHTETFGGIEGVIRGKSELFDYLKKTEGVCFLNIDDKVLVKIKPRLNRVETYPTHDFHLVSSHPFLKVSLKEQISETLMIGKYNFCNMAAAVALGKYFEVNNSEILTALASYESNNSRSQIMRIGTNTLILDAYNANPDSMKAALDNLASYSGKKLAILGDMNELKDPLQEHMKVMEYIHHLNIDVLTIGVNMRKVSKENMHFTTKQDLIEKINHLNIEDTTILLKASRSIELETILHCFQ